MLKEKIKFEFYFDVSIKKTIIVKNLLQVRFVSNFSEFLGRLCFYLEIKKNMNNHRVSLTLKTFYLRFKSLSFDGPKRNLNVIDLRLYKIEVPSKKKKILLQNIFFFCY
jgi:hypothetical protein